MLPQAIINGLLYGAVYGIIGIGFSLVWGVMHIINLSHGSFIMIGAYLAFTFFKAFGLDPFLSLPLVMAILFLIGYVLQKYLLNQIVRGSVFITLTFTFGLQILISNLCLLIWGADYRSINLAYSGSGINVGEVVIPIVRFVIFGVAIVITFLFNIFMRKTKTGISINATSLNLEGAKTVGINVANVYSVTFGISAALAGAAGCLISPIMSMNPFTGGALVGKAFVIAILGGLGSTIGALVGGLVLGLVETVSTVYIPSSYQEFMGFLVLVLVLIFRPQGLLGKRFFE